MSRAYFSAIRLVPPGLDLIEDYAIALSERWSPDTVRNVSAEQLAALRADPAEFLRRLTDADGTVTLPDGRAVRRIPFRLYWISDGGFCGSINLRWLPGTEELPPHVSGHVGYSIVPWKRRHGYATRALALLLPIAAEVGLRRVMITTDDDNVASRRVIEVNGGSFLRDEPNPDRPGTRKRLYWVDTQR